MPKIALLVNDLGRDMACAIAAVRKETSLPIGEIVRRSKSLEPVLELNMSGSDLAERVHRLQALVRELSTGGATVEMYELLNKECFQHTKRESLVKTDVSMLDNMLTADERERRYQERIDAAPDKEGQE